MRIEGQIIVCVLTKCSSCCFAHNLTEQGFDEFMNVVLDQAAEVYVNGTKPRRELGE